MQALLDAVDALLAGLPARPEASRPAAHALGPRIGSWGEADQYVPSVRTVRAQLAKLTPAQRGAVLRRRVEWVRVVKLELANKFLRGVPGPPLSSLERAREAATTVAAYPGVLKSTAQLDYRLRLAQRATRGPANPEELRTERAYAALQIFETDQGRLDEHLAQYASDPLRSAEFVLEARCLEDVYLRFAIAVHAAATAGSTVARALALYRAEGDLNVPYSYDTLWEEPVGLPPGRSNARHTLVGDIPYLHSLVAVYDVAKLDRLIGGKPSQQARENQARLIAEETFDFLLVGLDVLHRPKLRHEDHDDEEVSPTEWLARNLQAADPKYQPATPTNEDQKRAFSRAHVAVWEARERRQALLRYTERPGRNGPYGVVTCDGPVYYVSSILTEALRHMAYCAQADRLFPHVSGKLPELLVYARYHAGRLGVQRLLASAMGWALREEKRYPEAAALAELIRGSNVKDVEDKLIAVSKASPADANAIVAANWFPHFSAVLRKPAGLDVLVAWLRAADVAVWKSWSEVRANLARYEQLHDYYKHWLNLR